MCSVVILKTTEHVGDGFSIPSKLQAKIERIHETEKNANYQASAEQMLSPCYSVRA